ncbi:MAG: dihydrofolate reductase [Betaproteobacteria bacterium]|nr:dihydrofolate reductase [Betaproteobacteria bacterium]
MPTVSLIVAHDRQRGIGKDNRMPWHLPGELAHFKRTTMGKPVIMGRNTHESIGRVLPGRRNIVVTSRPLSTPGIETADSLPAALALCANEADVMVIGGGQLYRAALPLAKRIFATEIHADFAADTHFPPLDAGWRELSRAHQPADERDQYAYDTVVFQRD